jgi:hypothetical protein
MGWTIRRNKLRRPLTSQTPGSPALPDPEKQHEHRPTLLTVAYALLRMALVVAFAGFAFWLLFAH